MPLSFNLFGVRLQTTVERPLTATCFKPVNRFSCEAKSEQARREEKEWEGDSLVALPPTFSVRFSRLTLEP